MTFTLDLDLKKETLLGPQEKCLLIPYARVQTVIYIVNQTWKTAIYISLGSLVMSKLGTRGSHKKYISCILVTFSDIISDMKLTLTPLEHKAGHLTSFIDKNIVVNLPNLQR